MAPLPEKKAVEKTEEGPPDLSKYENIIDPSAFEQILEMDDDSEREFSKGIVYGFFEQADSTFEKMEKAIIKEDLTELSHLGHFLKGSSATLGLTKIKDACEKIQHYGARKDESGTVEEPDDKISMTKIKDTLADVKKDYDEVAVILKRFYGEKPSTS